MKRLQCVKCDQIFWMDFKPKEEVAFVKGDWIQSTCPKCGSDWTSVLGQRSARRAKRGVRRSAMTRRKGPKRAAKRRSRGTGRGKRIKKTAVAGIA